ncbi:hypothetical protein ACFQT0_19330 [Hymenobacter humi]|uniref:Uncharacterized protein n=1 Tax=Hymenobacter humi TaxID=1411620 RepID=A0ABW2UA31_9BACT
MNATATTTEPAVLPDVSAAMERFYGLNDDLDAVQATNRRVLFEFLRTKPSLSVGEIDTLETISELLADLSIAKRRTACS